MVSSPWDVVPLAIVLEAALIGTVNIYLFLDNQWFRLGEVINV